MFDPRTQPPLSFLADEISRGHFFAGSGGEFRRAAVAATAGFALVTKTSVWTGATGSATGSPVDTTGANLIVICTGHFTGSGGTAVVSDSKGNTWTELGRTSSPTSLQSVMFYCLNPTVGAGHTFTIGSDVGIYTRGQIYAFSGAISSGVSDQQNGAANASTSTLQPGSVTPSVGRELIITTTFTGVNAVGTTIDSGFSTPDSFFDAGTGFTMSSAFLIQVNAAAVNPTWTYPASGAASARIATFKAQ